MIEIETSTLQGIILGLGISLGINFYVIFMKFWHPKDWSSDGGIKERIH